MTDSATSRYGARKQSLGSNVNTWGDTKLNDVIDLIDRGSKGYQSVTMTGDTTLTWTNYATTNQGQVQTLKLAGSLSSAASLTIPSREWAFTVINSTGATVTVKTAAGSGVDIPTGYQASLYCDGTDVSNASPTLGPTFTPGTSNAYTNKNYVDTAIATAGLPATAGTILNSGSDTTAGYLAQKVTVQASGALTLQVTTINGGANEQLQFSGAVGALGLSDGGTISTTGQTLSSNTKYIFDLNATTQITTLGPSAPSVGDLLDFTKIGTGTLVFDPNGNKIRSSTSTVRTTKRGRQIWRYTGTTDGWD